jgi:hypothetical protein
VNQQTIHALNQWAAQIQTALVKVAPVAWHTMVAVKQADCIGAIVTGIIAAVILAIVATVALRIAFAWNQEESGTAGAFTLYVFGACAALGSLGIVIFGLLDQWFWIGAFNPNLAVAHDVILKALGQ